MRTYSPIDPNAVLDFGGMQPTVGVGTTYPTGASSSCALMYFMNKSNIGVNVCFDNGQFLVIPAWWARAVVIPPTCQQMYLTTAYALNLPNPPISLLYMEAYGGSEDTSKLYSGPLPYQTGVQGNTSVSTTSANALQNDGNAASTSILETTVSGQTSSNQTATNDGLWVLKTLISGVMHQWLKTQAVGNLLQLGNNADTVETLGNLQVDGDLTSSGTLTLNNNFVLVQVGGTTYFVLDSTGITMSQSSPIRWVNGIDTLSQTHRFTGTGSGTYNHGCHASPFGIMPVCSVAGSSQTEGAGNITSTQVDITTGAGLSFWAFCVVG